MTDLVFISYSNADKSVADAICAELERAGVRCWIAPRDITPGRIWGEAIMDGIDSSRVMVIVHSRHANRSQQVVREIERAVDRRLFLLPVRLQDIKLKGALEYYLSSSQWLDAFPGPIDAYLASLPRLVQNLLAEAKITDEHTAERTAERAAEQSLAQAAEQTTAPPVMRPLNGSPMTNEGLLDDAPTTVSALTRARTSRWKVVSVAALTTVIAVSTWLYTQLVRDKAAPTEPSSISLNSSVDSSGASAAKPPLVGKDSVVPALRIAASMESYKIGERFSVRLESRGSLPVRWRSGNSRVIGISPGDSVFHAIAAGRAFLFAESATQRDSVRINVVESARIADRNPTRPPPPQLPPTVKETTTTTSGREKDVVPAKEKDALPALTAELASTKAGDCMQAIVRHDAAWMRTHYGSPLAVNDAANLKNLESLFGKRGYKAALLQAATFSGNSVTFSMRVDYQGGFGPRLTMDVPFELRMVNDLPHGEVATCRVRGALKSP